MSELGAVLDILVALLCITLPPGTVASIAPDPETGKLVFLGSIGFLLAATIYSVARAALRIRAGAAAGIATAMCLLAFYGVRDLPILSPDALLVCYGAMVLALRFLQGLMLGRAYRSRLAIWQGALLLALLAGSAYGLAALLATSSI